MSRLGKTKDLKRIIDDLNSDVQDLVDLISIDAKNEGFQEGYEKGKAEGYDKGYQEGEAEGKEEGIAEERERWTRKEKVSFS